MKPLRLDRGLETLEDRSTPAVFNAVVDPGQFGANNAAAVTEILGFFNTAIANGEPDTINLFPNRLYTFGSSSSKLSGASALPTIGPDGTGKNTLTVNGNGASFIRASSEDFRYFHLSGDPNLVELVLNDITLTSGKSIDGGAILVEGGAKLTVNNTKFSGNNATGNGGAIAFIGTAGTNGGGLFNNVIFANNTAAGNHGAFSNTFDGFFRFNNSSFTNNSSSNGSGAVGSFVGAFEFNDTLFDSNTGSGLGSAGAFGGTTAVFNRATITNNTASSGGTGGVSSGLANIRVDNSYIAGNVGSFSVGSGGGVQGARVEVFNSTIDRNKTGSGGGGGIAGTDVFVRNSTITRNNAVSAIGGGGIKANTLSMSGSIVQGNTPDNVDGKADILLTVNSVSQGFNIVGTSKNNNFTGSTGDQLGKDTNAAGDRVDPLLGAPQANGGPTLTRAPQAGSPAINNGPTIPSVTIDQRGFSRIVGGRSDVGSFEVQTGNAVAIVAGNNQTTPTNQPFTNPVKALVTDPNGAPVSGVLVSFTAPSVPNPTASAVFAGGQPSTGVATDFNGFATVNPIANGTAGSYALSADVKSGTPAAQALLRNTSFGITIPVTGNIAIIQSSNNQSAPAGSLYTKNIQVQVTDTKNNPIPNVPITFTAPQSGASITFAGGSSSLTQSTDAQGFVSLPVTANTVAGTVAISASGPNVGIATFALTNLPAAASKVTVVSGTGQATLTKSAFDNPLVVAVTDIFGNPVLAGVGVSFVSGGGGAGALFNNKSLTTVLTDATGRAQALATANSVGGKYFVDSSVSAGTLSASFGLTNIDVTTPPPPPTPVDTAPPVITDAPNITVPSGTTQTVAFGVFDAVTLSSNLKVNAVSSDTTLIPTLTLGGTGTNRTLDLVTVANGTGTATITVTVADEAGNIAKDTFDVAIVPPTTVPPPGTTPPTVPPNTAPVITRVSNRAIQAGKSSTDSFLVLDAETTPNLLTITAKSSNVQLVPTVNITGADSTRGIEVVTNPSVTTGGISTITLSVTDAGGLTSTTTFDVNVFVVPPPPPPPPPSVDLVGNPQFAVGSGSGGSQIVRFFNADRTERAIIAPFPDRTGGIRTATGDFNRDGVADIVVGTGPGSSSQVKIIDGTTQAELFAFNPFEATFTGGVYVATGDTNNDGTPEVLVTPDEGGGPRVRILNGAGFSQIDDFFAIDDPNFRGGARVATGDINGDGVADLLASAGFGGGPRIAGFDGTTLGRNRRRLFDDFFMFEETLRNGAFVAAGDLDGDGLAEVIAGAGPGGGPRILAFSGKSLLSNTYIVRANFFGGLDSDRGGVRVAVKNIDADNLADIVIGSGDGSGSRVTGYLGANITPEGTPLAGFTLESFPGFNGGVFVG